MDTNILPRDAHRANFLVLSRDEQAAAIRRLAAEGVSDLTLAAATGYAVEQIRSIVGERNAS